MGFPVLLGKYQLRLKPGETMSHFALWIDHKYAHTYELQSDILIEKNFELPEHPSHRQLHGPDDKDKGYIAYYDKIARSLMGADKLLILGPGVAKKEFQHRCEKHHPNLAKSIVEVITMESHPTHNQVLEKIKEKFQLES